MYPSLIAHELVTPPGKADVAVHAPGLSACAGCMAGATSRKKEVKPIATIAMTKTAVVLSA